WRPLHEERSNEAYRADDDAVGDQCGLEALGFEGPGDGEGGHDSAEAIAGGGDACCQSTAVREPLHHETDNADIDNSGAQASEQAVGQVKAPEGIRLSGQNPAQSRNGSS